MFQFVCPEDDGIQQDWFYHSGRQMFVRCERGSMGIRRKIYGKYLANPDHIRTEQRREPSKVTQALWDFWHKVKEGGVWQQQPQT